jgi:DNA-binding NarL/FixJ family response regulator
VLREVLGCHELAQVPLLVSETQLRLLVLARREAFSAGEMDFLRVAQRPLGAIDRVLRALEPHPVGPHGTTLIPQPPEPVAPAEDCGLTRREVEVLRLLADGLLANTIAARMNVSARTVHKHLGNVYRKLDAHDRLLAVRRAQSIGLIPV